jgi:hypothetical protein
MRRAGHIGLLPHDLAFRAESRDLDLKLRRRGADVDRDFLALCDAALTGVAFDEKGKGSAAWRDETARRRARVRRMR